MIKLITWYNIQKKKKEKDVPEKIATQLYEQCVQNALLGYVLIVLSLFIPNDLYL
jgi:hypothetical protein